MEHECVTGLCRAEHCMSLLEESPKLGKDIPTNCHMSALFPDKTTQGSASLETERLRRPIRNLIFGLVILGPGTTTMDSTA